MYSSPIGGRGTGTHSGNVGWGHDMPIPIPLVQHGGFGAQKGWGPPVLYQLPQTE